MQERRTTIRIGHRCRMQYCGSDDLLSRDGQLTNLSERGVGLRLRESHRSGERITISFALPGADDPLTATGVLRWGEPTSIRPRWYGAGLEWLPMEEATRNRLHAFLSSCAIPVSPPRSAVARSRGWSWSVRLAIAFLALTATVLGGMVVVRRFHALQHENLQFASALQQRDSTITQLAHDGARLQEELKVARTQLSSTAEKLQRVDERTQHLTGEVERLNRNAEAIQQSYLRVRQQREQLTQHLLELQQENTTLAQERAHLAGRLSSLPELRPAIREAIEVRRHEAAVQRRARRQAKREAERDQAIGGNQGYLIREGRQTINQSTVWIRVHEPESLPSTQ